MGPHPENGSPVWWARCTRCGFTDAFQWGEFDSYTRSYNDPPGVLLDPCPPGCCHECGKPACPQCFDLAGPPADLQQLGRAFPAVKP